MVNTHRRLGINRSIWLPTLLAISCPVCALGFVRARQVWPFRPAQAAHFILRTHWFLSFKEKLNAPQPCPSIPSTAIIDRVSQFRVSRATQLRTVGVDRQEPRVRRLRAGSHQGSSRNGCCRFRKLGSRET